MPCLRWLVGFVLLAGACERGGRAGAAAEVPESEVIARVEGQPITRADLEKQVASRAPYVQFRFSSPEKKKELLENLVRFEVLAREAQSRGYDRDPDVLRYQKQRAIDRMLAEEVDAKNPPEQIPRTELEAYYRQHPELFTQKEGIRLQQIVVRDAELANRVAAEARSLGPRDDAGFRKLVAEHSIDEDSKQRGGDLTFVERDERNLPRPVVDAAFALADGNDKVGMVAGPIASPAGFHIIRLTQRRAQFLRPFDEVERLVRTRVAEERRRKQIEAWVADARGRVKIEVFEDRLSQVKVGGDAGASPGAPEAPRKQP